LGDAAHPMTPNLSQGAGLAIEDALVLAQCLAEGSDVAAALRTYVALRQPRTAQFTRQSWRIGKVGQWESPWACRLRNQLFKLFPTRLAERQLESALAYSI
jgi:2-polyprenyl-6-methoxyphenol hydroxylase-like FAD-dependent oxidoreductase